MQLMISPFGKVISDNQKNISTFEKLDAIYIPTLEFHNQLATNIDLLLKYAREVVLIYTDDIADWGIKKNRVRIERLKAHKDFLDEFTKRKENYNIAIKWRETFDIPHKRSFALSDAKKRKYHKIMFLDDDLVITEANIHKGLIGLQSKSFIVGFHVLDYPDVSTIDHLERIILNKKNVISMTGSCMFVDVDNVHGDFLNIYNEDLFFYLSQPDANKIVSGGVIYQNPYIPWEKLDRIKHEQFGDLIYDAFKRRFIQEDSRRINWEEEKNIRIKRIQNIQYHTTDKQIMKALDGAIEGLIEIDTREIHQFVDSCELAAWVKKYL